MIKIKRNVQVYIVINIKSNVQVIPKILKMDSQLEELIQFLESTSRVELKSVAITNILSLTGSHEIVEVLIKNAKLLKTLVDLTTDASFAIAKDACFGEL